MKRLATILLLTTTAALAQKPAPEPVDDTAPVAKATRIVLVGDSTVNHGTGWGSAFCDRLAGDIECFNVARNGRSSKSYRAEGFWQRALDLHPKYILIHFGGNDVPGKGPDRETTPDTTYAGYLRDDIREARAAGAIPVLVTSLPTRRYKAGKHIRTLEDYAAAMRKVGAETKTPVLDLNTEANDLLDGMTEAQAHQFNYNSADLYTPGTDDGHLNARGGAYFGALVARDFAAAFPKIKINTQQPR